MSTWDDLNKDEHFLDPLYLCVECGSHIPRKEGETFPPCERCGNKEAAKFVFPAEIPGEYRLEFFRRAVEDDGKVNMIALVPLMPLLFGKKRYERLQELFESEVIARVHNNLLKIYDIVDFGHAVEEADPLGKATATPPKRSSSKPSSRTGGRSKRTSKGSSTSKTSTKK